MQSSPREHVTNTSCWNTIKTMSLTPWHQVNNLLTTHDQRTNSPVTGCGSGVEPAACYREVAGLIPACQSELNPCSCWSAWFWMARLLSTSSNTAELFVFKFPNLSCFSSGVINDVSPLCKSKLGFSFSSVDAISKRRNENYTLRIIICIIERLILFFFYMYLQLFWIVEYCTTSTV